MCLPPPGGLFDSVDDWWNRTTKTIETAPPAQVEEATPEESLAIARNFARKAAEADSVDHVAAYLESALIFLRGA